MTRHKRYVTTKIYEVQRSVSKTLNSKLSHWSSFESTQADIIKMGIDISSLSLLCLHRKDSMAAKWHLMYLSSLLLSRIKWQFDSESMLNSLNSNSIVWNSVSRVHSTKWLSSVPLPVRFGSSVKSLSEGVVWYYFGTEYAWHVMT